MKVFISNRQKSLCLTSHRQTIKNLVYFVLEKENTRCDELSIFFITDTKMKEMHQEFFNDDSSTDCISFPLDDSYLGDIFICPETALAYARKCNKNPYVETTLYIIHGLLHLLGYDDIDKGDRKIMRSQERKHMKALKEARLLLHG